MKICQPGTRRDDRAEEHPMVCAGTQDMRPDVKRLQRGQPLQDRTHDLRPAFVQRLTREIQGLDRLWVRQGRELLVYPDKRVQVREGPRAQVHPDIGRGHPPFEVPLEPEVRQR